MAKENLGSLVDDSAMRSSLFKQFWTFISEFFQLKHFWCFLDPEPPCVSDLYKSSFFIVSRVKKIPIPIIIKSGWEGDRWRLGIARGGRLCPGMALVVYTIFKFLFHGKIFIC